MARPRLSLALLVAVMALAAGCRVQTTVSVLAVSPTAGTVTVTVRLDASAVQAVGGQAALRSGLSVADLRAAGWVVTGPTAGPGTDTTVAVSHGFTTPAEADQLLADVAGSGASSSRVFRLSLARHRDFWHTYTTLTGTVDLRCGVTCFGDAGLKSLFGSPTGIDPRTLGGDPSKVLGFSVTGKLPGQLKESNARSSAEGVLTWTPALGRATVVSAESQSWNAGSVALVVTLAALVYVTFMVIAIMWWVRRRRRHRQMKEERERAVMEAVTPSA